MRKRLMVAPIQGPRRFPRAAFGRNRFRLASQSASPRPYRRYRRTVAASLRSNAASAFGRKAVARLVPPIGRPPGATRSAPSARHDHDDHCASLPGSPGRARLVVLRLIAGGRTLRLRRAAPGRAWGARCAERRSRRCVSRSRRPCAGRAGNAAAADRVKGSAAVAGRAVSSRQSQWRGDAVARVPHSTARGSSGNPGDRGRGGAPRRAGGDD